MTFSTGLASAKRAKNPLYLGDEAIAQRLQLKAQRRVGAPPLDQPLAIADRHPAMAQAHRKGCYSLKEIAETFGVHCATVSRAVKVVPAGNRL